MTPMTRSDLKNIVKECLVEILAEGIGGKINESRKPSPAASSVTQKGVDKQLAEMQKMRQTIANKVQYGQASAPAKQPAQSSVKNLVKSVTNDEIMASLFADTALTTLQEQVESDRRLLKGHSQDSAPESDAPVGGSGFSEEMALHWSSLAFSDPKKKK